MQVKSYARAIGFPIATVCFIVSIIGNHVFWNSEHSKIFDDRFLSLNPFIAISACVIAGTLSYFGSRFVYSLLSHRFQQFSWIVICFAAVGQSLGAISFGLFQSNIHCIYAGVASGSVALGLSLGTFSIAPSKEMKNGEKPIWLKKSDG
jgi:hypothetical protein